MMQAGKDYGVRVIRPFQQFSPGFVMYPTAIYREKLIRGGFVEPVAPPVPTETPAIEEQPVSPAVPEAPLQRRAGKPR